MKLAIDLESSDEEVFTQHLLSISTKNAKKQNINTCFGSIQFEVRHTAMTSKSQNHNPSGSEPHCRTRQHGPWQARGITRPNSNLQRGFYVLILRDFYVLFFFFLMCQCGKSQSLLGLEEHPSDFYKHCITRDVLGQ